MNIICDSFADCPRTECETGAIRTYTKSNMKTYKTCASKCHHDCQKILRKCVKTLLRITGQQEELSIQNTNKRLRLRRNLGTRHHKFY